MAPTRRLIRRRTLAERIKSYLNPLDFLLWLSEELETSDWEQWQKDWATPIGVGLNLVMLIARANSGRGADTADDVFGDGPGGNAFFGWLAAFVVHFLSLLSFANAAFTFYRKRHYRLFETSVDAPPSTPSARRVKVESSPMSSSPLRILSNIFLDNSAQSRAHPDSRNDVWELSVWDPVPICLKMFCLFSPGHVLVYWLFLPTAPQDVRPSVTVAITISLATIISFQLFMLREAFSQLSKDTSLLHKEVLNEYDIKYVHPRTQHVMRDVGTQFSEERDSFDGVDEYAPVTVVNSGFHTNPNPNYARHTDPQGSHHEAVRETPKRSAPPPGVPSLQTPARLRDFSSPVPQRATALRQPGYRASVGNSGGDGGNLGIYSHAHSPLKKSASTNFPANQRLARVQGSPVRRQSGML